MPCRRSPIPRAAAEGETLNTLKGKGPTILKVFKVSPPAGVAGIDTWKAGKWRWHHDFLSFLNFAAGPGAEGETLRNKLKRWRHGGTTLFEMFQVPPRPRAGTGRPNFENF